MTASPNCPECGAPLPADAPGRLCPRCLIGAAFVATPATKIGTSTDEPAFPSDDEYPNRFAGSREGEGPSGQATILDIAGFRQAVQELGLIRAEELERIVAGAPGGVEELASALVRAGKLTAYQAEALCKGKGRELVIGNYFVLDKLGAGGMGVVFKARHRRLGRIVAMKVLSPSLARDADLLKRFRREVDVAARLSHPNIVSVLDADDHHGVQFMTMEYIQGNDLDHLVSAGGILPVEQALDCVIQAARGLEAAHAEGIVHRDIKPGNLMLDGSGLVRVLDLGLARLVEASNPFGETVSGPLTQSGTYMGTVDFMAPEQGIDSSKVDHRADIYSLGCTLCYLLTGRPPFEEPTVLAKLMAHQDRAPSSLLTARPDLPRNIDAVYQKMMAKKPADRPESMSAVIALLEACRSSPSEAARARSGLLTVLATVGMKRATPAAPGLFAVPGPVPQPAPPGRTARLRPRAVAIGALVLMAVGGLGYALLPRGGVSAPANRGVLARSERASVGLPPQAARGVVARSERASVGSPPQAAPRPDPTFDVVTLYEIHDNDGLAGSVDSIAVTADGQKALIGSWTEHAEMIDVLTGKREDPPLGRHGGRSGWLGAALNAAMSLDGRRGLVGTATVRHDDLQRLKAREAGIVWFWDLTTGEELFPKQQPYHGPVTAVAISGDGLRGLSASQEGELTLWDLTTGQVLRSLGPQKGRVASHALAFFPDGRRAASGGRDRLVHIWDLDSGRELAAWTGHDRTISGLAIAPGGRRIVTGSDDATVILWDVDRGALLHRFTMPPNDSGARVTFDSDSNIVAAGHGMDGTPPRPGHLIVWDADTYAVLRHGERPFARHLVVAALPGGRLLTGDRYALRLWTPRQPGAAAAAPPAAASRDTAPVNLLALVQPQTYQIGTWQMHSGELFSPPTSGARLQIPYEPPPEYRIDMEVERVGKGGNYVFAIGVVVGAQQIEIGIDEVVHAIGKCSGLFGYDGVPIEAGPGVHRGQLVFPSRPARFALTVRRGSINLTCDGVSVVDWTGDPKRFIPYQRWRVPDPRRIFLMTTSSVRFHTMTLTPLTAASP